MFGSEDQGLTLRDILLIAEFKSAADDLVLQPEMGIGPGAGDLPAFLPRDNKKSR